MVKLIVIDECFMVDEDFGCDFLFFGMFVLVLGDFVQLLLVKGGGFFIEVELDVMLIEVYCQV